MATKLVDLIEKVNADDLPTNEFTIEDKDPMVILGKLNEVIANLETLNSTINSSDSKASVALEKAIQAVADATQALSVANGIDAKATQALANAIEAVNTANTALSASNTALSTANTAISTANTALSSANSAVETAGNALDTAESAETKADTAITTANEAKTTADNIDAKATTALANSQTAVSTANVAKTKAQEALDQVVAGQGTKVYRDTQLLTSLDIKPIENNIAGNTTAITAIQNGKVDKVIGKQLSTEDFTTAEKTKLAGLSNYDDTQVQTDITALQTRATNIETKNAEQDTAIANINNKIYPIGSIYISTSQTSPASLFGGTWERLKDRFLLASGDTYPAGTTGGNATHTLTINEMPSHRHRLLSASNWSANCNGLIGYNTTQVGGVANTNGTEEYCDISSNDNNAQGKNAPFIENTGGNEAFSITPPYLAVYMWKRTA